MVGRKKHGKGFEKAHDPKNTTSSVKQRRQCDDMGTHGFQWHCVDEGKLEEEAG